MLLTLKASFQPSVGGIRFLRVCLEHEHPRTIARRWDSTKLAQVERLLCEDFSFCI